ncbi:hypothetical protein DP113_10410 [Brasilonema octagenarum UFV-E1]|uniref:PatA-like N-terminal domain-containing protein n=1 Tax=Brasilonema sennae CENA114 TaxID=415709 RepID=A0A856MD83_9CYAN|nr:DUF4388 domain-containing protein [Brasilonema sennae]QDL08270.1 hypothetical protein DP114_10465 [Brasilonema sennae CENA114]QDL14627.1 hypothetical protein DP113_10410 [Brasilonema octagenarum UFV-E1]
MIFTGNLAEFPLPSIFQLLEQGNNTGLLTIRTLAADVTAFKPVYYIWLYQGRIVAAADRLDEKGLLSMIAQRGWVSQDVALRMAQICRANTPIGLCLKFQGLLQAEQLKLLFRIQVVEQVSVLFELKDGQFEFDAEADLPDSEMTGISIPATEITLIGLRLLQDWSVLAQQLPELSLILSNKNITQPTLQLDSLELQVWQLANGTISLGEIANQLELAVEKVQQIAFRLLRSDLVEEVFLTSASRNEVTQTTFVAENLLGSIVDSSRQIDNTQPLNHIVAQTTPVAENLPESIVDSSRQIDNTQPLSDIVTQTTSVAENLPESVVDSSSQTNVFQSFLKKLGRWLRLIRSFFQGLFSFDRSKT